MDAQESQFVQMLVACQARLKSYIRTVVMDREAADELVQRTNLVLCQKAADFKPGTDFGAWACKVGYFEILAYRQHFAREREKLVFDDEQLREIAAFAEEDSGRMDDERRALRECLGRLPEKQQDLIQRRYGGGVGVQQIAAQLSRPAGSIRQTLFRIRLVLMECIQRRLGPGDLHE